MSRPSEVAWRHIAQGSAYLIGFHHLLRHREDGLDVALGKFVRQLAHGGVVLERGDSLSDEPSRTRPDGQSHHQPWLRLGLAWCDLLARDRLGREPTKPFEIHEEKILTVVMANARQRSYSEPPLWAQAGP